MAKKFVRSITGIKDINHQDLSTNNVGDLLSDGKDIYVHRKNGAKEEYFNLTSDKGDKYIADGDSGLEIWQKGGEDGKRIKLSQEFLKNNAQYISTEENSGLKATPRQDKYGNSYEIGFTDEAKAKMQDVVNKVNNIPQGGKSKPIKITKDWSKCEMTAKETDDSVTLGLSNKVLTADNLRGDTSTLGGEYITLEEVTWREPDEMGLFDYNRTGYGIHLDETYWASRRNMKTTKGSGILLKEETDLSGLKLDTEDITFDIDSTKLLRHDCLLGDEGKGIKVWHTDGQSTSAISLTDDVWAKIQKIDSLSAGGGSGSGTSLTEEQTTNIAKVPTIETKVNELTPKVETLEGTVDGVQFEVAQLKANKANYTADGDTITFSEDLDGNKVIGVNPSLKKQINNAVNLEQRVGQVEKKLGSMVENGTEPISITSDNGSVTVTRTGNNFDLALDTGNLDASISQKVSNELSAELDVIHTLIEGTTVEAPLTKSYNQTDKGRTVNIGLSELATNRIAKVDTIETNVSELTDKVTGLQPLFKTKSTNGLRCTIVGIPYGDSNYLATITLETAPISSDTPVTIARTDEFAKWLSAMSFPTDGGYQSGTIILTKQASGAINVTTAQDANTTKCQGQFTMVISKI